MLLIDVHNIKSCQAKARGDMMVMTENGVKLDAFVEPASVAQW